MALFGKSLYDYRDNIILNEAYIGKTSTLLEIEAEIDALRKSNPKMTENISVNPHIIKINRLFEKQFGMDTFALKILPSNTINAYTMVLAKRFDIAEEIDLPSTVTGNLTEGFRFKPDNEFVILVSVYYGLFFNEKMSPAQIVAIILHEIGHNFADCLYDTINFANKDMMNKYRKWASQLTIFNGILTYILNNALLKKLRNDTIKNKEEKAAKRGKLNNKIRGFVAGVKGKFNDWDQLVTAFLHRITGRSTRNIKTYKRISGEAAKEKARKSIDRQNEVFADKFAGVYGYGPELASGLANMHTIDKVRELAEKFGKGAIKACDEYDEATRDINDYDCHPNLVQRLMAELNLLQREYAKEDVDPKVKKIINEQIEELKELLDKLTDVKKKVSKSEDAQRAYNDYVKNNCPNAVSEEIEDAIEESLDKLLDESKKKKNKNK